MSNVGIAIGQAPSRAPRLRSQAELIVRIESWLHTLDEAHLEPDEELRGEARERAYVEVTREMEVVLDEHDRALADAEVDEDGADWMTDEDAESIRLVKRGMHSPFTKPRFARLIRRGYLEISEKEGTGGVVLSALGERVFAELSRLGRLR